MRQINYTLQNIEDKQRKDKLIILRAHINAVMANSAVKVAMNSVSENNEVDKYIYNKYKEMWQENDYNSINDLKYIKSLTKDNLQIIMLERIASSFSSTWIEEYHHDFSKNEANNFYKEYILNAITFETSLKNAKAYYCLFFMYYKGTYTEETYQELELLLRFIKDDAKRFLIE